MSNFSSKLNHRISFLSNKKCLENVKTTDYWEKIISCFAQVRAMVNYKPLLSQSVNFGHIVTEGYYIFTIRFRKDISLDMRIEYENRIFIIQRITNLLEKNFKLEIMALEN